jgi:hypothetical protein
VLHFLSRPALDPNPSTYVSQVAGIQIWSTIPALFVEMGAC